LQARLTGFSDSGQGGSVQLKEGLFVPKRYDTYKYQFKVGNKIVHGGITNDLERREQEHKQGHPKGHITQVGRKTTEEAARKWEKEKGYT
jgi:hypothetical protein